MPQSASVEKFLENVLAESVYTPPGYQLIISSQKDWGSFWQELSEYKLKICRSNLNPIYFPNNCLGWVSRSRYNCLIIEKSPKPERVGVFLGASYDEQSIGRQVFHAELKITNTHNTSC